MRCGYGGQRVHGRRRRDLRDAGRLLEEVGIPRGDYIIRVNNRKVLNGVLEATGVSDPEQKAAVLRTIDKFDKVGELACANCWAKGRSIPRVPISTGWG